jgi:hypothetical protein
MAGTVIIPWYSTGFRGADLESALNELAPTALRYGATSYAVYRARDDRYKFQQFAAFEDKLDWERYWEGQEMTDFRVIHSSWYQVPVLYGWWDLTAGGGLVVNEALAPNGHVNGSGNGASSRTVEGESA